MKHLSATALFIAFGWLLLPDAEAQIQVDLELDRNLYLAHEPVTGTLTLVNRAGQDLVFGDTAGMSWLDFTVTDNRGHLITPVRGRLNESPIVLAAGQTYKHKVTINRQYPMSSIGIYRVKANVSFPQINRVFESRTVSIQVTEGQPMWSQIVGVPQGYPGAGSYREYQLMTYYHGARSKALYFRLRDSDSGQVYKTYPIGDYLEVRKPSHAIDRMNQLHVLHMTGPQRYQYTVIAIDGEPIRRERFYEKGTNRPQLRSTESGEVSVVGGITESEAATPYEEAQFRRMSERPPGLPGH